MPYHYVCYLFAAPVVLLSYMDLPETMSLDGACVTESNVDDELFDQDDQIKYRYVLHVLRRVIAFFLGGGVYLLCGYCTDITFS